MTRLKWQVTLGVGTALVLLVIGRALLACSIEAWEPDYGPNSSLDDPQTEFAAGHLGIVHADAGVRDLVVAWRVLSGRPLSAAEQQSFEAQPATEQWVNGQPSGGGESPMADWGALTGQDFRGYHGPFNAQSWAPGVYRAVTTGSEFDTFLNCPADAFRNAAATLRDRQRRYAGAPELLQGWVTAQKMVFDNCAGPEPSYGRLGNQAPQSAAPQIPEPLAADAPALGRADRDYQVAAAYFYAMEYQQAALGFEAIARDRDSPWRTSAGYLAARAMVREATVQPSFQSSPGPGFQMPGMDATQETLWLGKAEAQINTVLADRTDATWWVPAKNLRGYIELRLHPQQRALELTRQLAVPNDPTFGQDTVDLAYIGGSAFNERARDPLLQWVALLSVYSGRNDGAFHDELQQWRATRSLPWLVAALHTAEQAQPTLAGGSEVAALIAAARRVPPDSPGFATVQYEALRIEQRQGAPGQTAVQNAVAALPLATMPYATRNQFRSLEMATAPTLAKALAAAARTSKDGQWTGFDADARTLFNDAMPLTLLAQAAESSTGLPGRMQGQLLVAAWTRAVILGDDATVVALSPRLAAMVPELAPYLARYESESGPGQYGERAFETTWILLHFPGMTPFVQERLDWSGKAIGLDEFDPDDGNNWWQRYGVEGAPQGYAPPPFINTADVYRWVEESAQIQGIGPGVNLLCQRVLQSQQVNDPRQAEALALAVAATGRAHGNDQTGGLSKQCYDLLHSMYANTEWAKQTTRWYTGECGKNGTDCSGSGAGEGGAWP